METYIYGNKSGKKGRTKHGHRDDEPKKRSGNGYGKAGRGKKEKSWLIDGRYMEDDELHLNILQGSSDIVIQLF